MALTKPAGCALQVFGAGALLGGCGMMSDALTPGSTDSATPGLLLLILGAAVFAAGGMPARQAAKARAAAAAEASRPRQKCPGCAELILAEARKCKHCGEAIQG